ncbi:MAG: acyl-CoA dehydrogenase family protein [Deltaproteobacteria bacterium]|nr:acyl-CoA dehydrogenase family protein [Deltaproteobacteria bacterium]
MADLEEFRASVRSWLEANAPKSLRGKMRDPAAAFWGGKKTKLPYPDSKPWLDMMAERGWTIPFWPKEYGGGGLSKEETKVLNEELARLELPPPLTGFGITMIGPTILQYGTEEQKKLYIPQIIKGEIRWCQGYSEPNAGSDLANIQTKAVVDGDDYIVNGQKIWTSFGDLSDWIFMLVRTNWEVKKQAGITFLLADMESKGVEVRPIKLISGASPFCEVFFEDVRVPRHQILNRENGGWEVARALLGHERTMIANTFGGRQSSTETKENPMEAAAKKYIGLQDGKIADDAIRQRMAQNQIDEQSFLLTVQRNSDNIKAGHRPGPETSIFKVYGTELNQRRQELMLSIFGPECLGWEGDGFEKNELDLPKVWLRSRGNTLEGGSSEIQLNIIAKQVLGLPD